VIEARRTTASSPGMTDTIKIDFAAIPDYVREELAEATLESVRAFIRQPGGREFLDARKAAKKAAK
jgi:hypothetical protein